MEPNIKTRQLAIQTFIYYWIYSGVRKAFRKFDFNQNIEMYPFKGLL